MKTQSIIDLVAQINFIQHMIIQSIDKDTTEEQLKALNTASEALTYISDSFQYHLLKETKKKTVKKKSKKKGV